MLKVLTMVIQMMICSYFIQRLGVINNATFRHLVLLSSSGGKKEKRPPIGPRGVGGLKPGTGCSIDLNCVLYSPQDTSRNNF